MKALITTLAVLSLSVPCFADLTVDDLPYIDGTPLAERIDDVPVWHVLDHAEEDGEVQWAWLDNAGYSAYVVYPSEQDTLLPDDAAIPASDHMLTLRFVGDDQEYTFSRYGGGLVISGDDITFSYTAPNKVHLVDNDFSDGDLFIRGESIQVSSGFDGDFRQVTIFGDHIATVNDRPDLGSGLSGNWGVTSGADISIGSGLGAISDSTTDLSMPDAIRLSGEINFDFADSNLIPGEATPCRLTESHDTGEKKVLCGAQWTGDSYLTQTPQEQNPPKKKKSKGGSIPLSVLPLLSLMFILQIWTRKKP